MSYTPSRVPTISNVSLTSGDTEYSHTLADNCRHFQIKARGTTNVIRVAFETGKVAGSTAPYMTIEAGQVWVSPPNFVGNGATIFMANSAGSTDVEILEWTNQPNE